MDQYIDESQFEDAFKVGDNIMNAFALVYENQPHPDVSVQMVRLAKLRMLLSPDLDNKGIKLITETDKMIKITHRINHDLHKIYKAAIIP